MRIVDIAEELGVSTATVSNVIHGKTKKISDETVKRVQQLLEEKQYIPSMAGILLAQNNSRIIGVVINDHEKYEGHVLEDAFISTSLNHLSREIEDSGLFMMIKVTQDWNEIIRFASMWNMEGMIIIGFCEQDYQKLREKMRIPFVVYDGFFEKAKRICNLAIDDYNGGKQMGIYFRQQGYEKALCISDNDICMDHERLEGFREGMKREIELMIVPMVKRERQQFYQEHLQQIKSYPAIFAVSDYYAVELMQFLQSQGVRIPEEISIAGFDDNPICENVCPSLTTIKQYGKTRAKMAISMLQKLKNGEEAATIRLSTTLVVRESTR